MTEANYWTRLQRRQLTRRRLLQRSGFAAAGLGAYATVGCGDDDDDDDDDDDQGAPGATGTEGASGEQPSDSGSPQRGGTLTQIQEDDLPDLNHVNQVTSSLHGSLGSVANGVIQHSPTGEIVPDLASEWEQPEPNTYIFTFHEGVTWHDGEPFSPEDVKATFEYILSDPSPARLHSRKIDYLANVDPAGITVPDERTLSMVLSQPRGSFLDSIAVGWMTIGPAGILTSDPAFLDTNAVGTGAFMLDSYTPGSSVTLVRNPNYFLPDEPYVDELTTLLTVDQATALTTFEARRAVMSGIRAPLDVNLAEQLESRTDMVVEYKIQFGHAVFYPNHQREPFSDPRVRRAMNIAIDRQQALEVLNGGQGEVAAFISPGPFEYPRDELAQVPGYREDKEADRQEARQLLEAAGFADGLEVSIMQRAPSPQWEAWSIFMQDQWQQIGLNVSIQPTEQESFNLRRNELDFDVYVGAGTSRELGDPFFAAAQIGPANDFGFDDQEALQLFEAQVGEADEEARRQLVRQLEDRLFEIAAYFPLFHETAPFAWYPEVRNYVAPEGSPFAGVRQLSRVWLAG
ncbi:MAG: hypothetical protein GEU28_12635 [Dehalococcoidia bacterium]|nr:hypothetical protein [Dehalococcoidia bacterium]